MSFRNDCGIILNMSISEQERAYRFRFYPTPEQEGLL
ncbi:helix-turn-helix domain-containing protein [Bifidobacterium choerinum]